MLKLEAVKSEFALKFRIYQNFNMPTLAHIVGLFDKSNYIIYKISAL